MIVLIARRFVLALVTLFIISIIIFVGVEEPNPQRLGHARAEVGGGRPADADDQVTHAGVQSRGGEVAAGRGADRLRVRRHVVRGPGRATRTNEFPEDRDE